MTPKEFVKAFHDEKQDFLREYFHENSETDVADLIKSLNLNKQQIEILKLIFKASFRDIFTTILFGLDGSASIGGVQELYDLKDENGNQLSGGDIEVFAYEYFHEIDSQ